MTVLPGDDAVCPDTLGSEGTPVIGTAFQPEATTITGVTADNGPTGNQNNTGSTSTNSTVSDTGKDDGQDDDDVVNANSS